VEEEVDASGRANIAKIVGMNSRLPVNYEAPEHTIDIILDILKMGLASPTPIAEFDKKGNPQFPDGVLNDPNIVTQYENGMALLSPQVQQATYDFITAELDKGIIRCRAPWRNIFKPFFRDPSMYQKSSKEAKMLTSPIFNRGVRSDPEAYEQLKFVSHVLNQEDPTKHITKLSTEPRELTPDLEGDLLARGYQWSLTSLDPGKPPKGATPEVVEKYKQAAKDGKATEARESKVGKPDWNHPMRQKKGAKLVYKQGSNIHDVLSVEMGEDGRLYIGVPQDYGEPGTESDEKQRGMLMGGGKFSASQGKGHVPNNPLRYEKDWKKLTDELLMGKYGEPGGPYNDLDQLPCVKKGIQVGYHFLAATPGVADVLPRPGDWEEKNDVSGGDYLRWAIEGLKSLSADPAFKYGYLGKEVEEILKFDREKEMKLVKAREAEPDPTAKSKMAHGKGIYALIYKHTRIEDTAEQNRIVQQVEDAIAQGADWDALERILPESVMDAIGENAFMARVRAVSQMISKRGHAIFYRVKKAGTISGEILRGDQQDQEGRGGDWMDQQKDLRGQQLAIRDKSQWRGDERGPVSTNWLRQRARVGPTTTVATPGTPEEPAKPEPAMGPAAAAKPATGGLVKRKPSPPGQSPLGGLVRRNKMQKESRFMSWKEYTSVVYDPKVKVKDGCGFNVWGAAPTSHPLGVSIAGDANTSKTDPIGKGSHGRKRKRQSRT
ncbi:MAG: hypothetical protein ACXADO_09735, partial [Candidatus Thorarchaeota archaeon]|jgi:hypothetical protein